MGELSRPSARQWFTVGAGASCSRCRSLGRPRSRVAHLVRLGDVHLAAACAAIATGKVRGHG